MFMKIYYIQGRLQSLQDQLRRLRREELHGSEVSEYIGFTLN